VRFRRAVVTGTPDYAHELVLILRGREGSPGVNFITPFRQPGTDTAVLVNRGWAYAPDGVTVDEARWREPDTLYSGYVELVTNGKPAREVRGDQRLIRDVDRASIARAIPYPVAPLYLVAMADSATVKRSTPAAVQNHLARLEPPPLDEGPHMSYAIQWFSFAIIAIGGMFIALRHGRGV
jgi:surfeit locus 1 family protein